MNAGKGIAKLRKERGISQDELASLVGFSRVEISNLETSKGKRGVYLGTLLEICEKANFDKHRLAHFTFGLSDPGTAESEEAFMEIIDWYHGLSEFKRGEFIGYLKRCMEEGGDTHALTKAAEPDVGYG